MKFFLGVFFKKQMEKNLPKPRNSSTLYLGENCIYLAGRWKNSEVIVLEQNKVKLLILGNCIASHEEIQSQFRLANQQRDYSVLTKLSGNYNLILYENGSLHLYSDVSSLRPLFYVERDDFLVFCSNRLPLKQLFQLDVDIEGLACYLLNSGMADFTQKQSLIQKIKEIPPCHSIYITPTQSRLYSYWTDPEPISFQKAVNRFRKDLLLSVQKRIKNSQHNITSDLSGGLDSTTLTLIASGFLKKKERKLTAMTLDSISTHEIEDVTIAKEVANQIENLQHIVIDNNLIPLPYSDLDNFPLTDEPIPFHCMLDKMYSLMDHAKMCQSDIYLSGEGGDVVLLTPYTYLVEMIKVGKIIQWIKHSYGWSRVQHDSPFRWLFQAIKIHSLPYNEWLKTQAKNIRMRIDKRELFQWSNSPARALWYSEDARKLVSQRLEEFADVHPPISYSISQHGSLANIQLIGRIARSLQHINETVGLNTYFPYLDHHVINTCLGSFPEDRTTPYQFKPLIKYAFQNEMPHSLLKRSSKGEFTNDLFQGMKSNFDYVMDYFSSSLLAEIGLIDLTVFKHEIEKFSRGIQVGLWELNTTIAIECWLRKVKKDSLDYWENRGGNYGSFFSS